MFIYPIFTLFLTDVDSMTYRTMLQLISTLGPDFSVSTLWSLISLFGYTTDLFLTGLMADIYLLLQGNVKQTSFENSITVKAYSKGRRSGMSQILIFFFYLSSSVCESCTLIMILFADEWFARFCYLLWFTNYIKQMCSSSPEDLVCFGSHRLCVSYSFSPTSH